MDNSTKESFSLETEFGKADIDVNIRHYVKPLSTSFTANYTFSFMGEKYENIDFGDFEVIIDNFEKKLKTEEDKQKYGFPVDRKDADEWWRSSQDPAKKMMITKEICQDFFNLFYQLVRAYGVKVVDFALWYRARVPYNDTYEDNLLREICEFIVECDFLGGNRSYNYVDDLQLPKPL